MELAQCMCRVGRGIKIRKFKVHVDDSENVIWKCNFAFVQSFFNYSQSFGLQDVFMC